MKDENLLIICIFIASKKISRYICDSSIWKKYIIDIENFEIFEDEATIDKITT